MTNPIPSLKRAMGAFFRARRENIGWSVGELRRRTNTSDLQIEKIESGTDSVNTDTLLRVMLELGMSLHLTAQNSDEAAAVSIEGMAPPPPFLVCVDEQARQMYVLHWQGPAFLVQVVQTIPYTLRIVATYGLTTAQLHALPVWAELEAFLEQRFAKTVDLN